MKWPSAWWGTTDEGGRRRFEKYENNFGDLETIKQIT